MKASTFFFGFFFCFLFTHLFSVEGIAQGIKVSENSGVPDESAMLEVESTTRGFLPPRMTTEQRDAIVSPAVGLQIFNLTTECIEYFAGGLWRNVCGFCPGPGAPAQGVHVAADAQITWNWNLVNDALGFKFSTSNNYTNATDLGNITTYIQTGLGCGGSYSLYIWAYNSCGSSSVVTLTQSTNPCVFVCGSNVTFTYRGNAVTYGTVQNNGECWMDRNLGASQVASSYNDVSSYGDLFQWGRLDDGHQVRTSGQTPTFSPSDNPGHSNFIVSSGLPFEWRSPPNDNLWQGVNGINNPCPAGWRLSTYAELAAELASWGGGNPLLAAFASPLKMPAAGSRRVDAGGALDAVGVSGMYWASTFNVSNFSYGNYLDFAADHKVMTDHYRANGFSVRCILD